MSERAGDEGGVRRRALGGTAWTLLGYTCTNVLRLGGNVVLARLLFPEAFGVMAVIGVVIQGLWLFSDIGVGPSVIQSRRGDDPEFLNTAWTIQLVRGAALCLLTCLLAAPVAAFYGDAEPLAAQLVWFLPAAGLSALADGAASTRVFGHQRHLDLKRLTLLEVVSQATGLVGMVAWALLWPSVWALVAGTVLRSATRTALSHALLTGPPNRPCWSPAAARELFGFGRWILLSTVLTFCAGQLDRLILGRLVTWDLLGVYGIASALALLPVNVLRRLNRSVAFPLLSRLRDDPDGFGAAVARVRLPLLLTSGAVIAGLAAVAPELVDLLYDPRYQAAGWLLQALLIGSWLRVLELPNGAALLALGHSGRVALGDLVKLVALVLLLPPGLHVYGLGGGVVALVVAEAAKYVVTVVQLRRLQLPLFGMDLALSCLLAGTAALGALGARGVEAVGLPLLLSVAVGSAAGALPWLAALGLWWRRRGQHTLSALAGARGAARPAPAS
ncbi:MAG: oligosaccharide flippase family protein [Planctomycetota bacterium]